MLDATVGLKRDRLGDDSWLRGSLYYMCTEKGAWGEKGSSGIGFVTCGN